MNDEKDDGTEMVLKDSETIIVHPEEDEDQTDDQATDSDKPEDLEDLKHLGIKHILLMVVKTVSFTFCNDACSNTRLQLYMYYIRLDQLS